MPTLPQGDVRMGKASHLMRSVPELTKGGSSWRYIFEVPSSGEPPLNATPKSK